MVNLSKAILWFKFQSEFDANQRVKFYQLFASFLKVGVQVNTALSDFMEENCRVLGLPSLLQLTHGNYSDPTNLPPKLLIKYPFIVLFLLRILYQANRFSTPVAKAMKSMLPAEEYQVLIAANIGGVDLLLKGIEQAQKIAAASEQTKQKLRPIFLKTGFLLGFSLAIVIFFSVYLGPALQQSLGGTSMPLKVEAYFQFLDLTLLVLPFIVICLIGIGLGLVYLLPNYVKSVRLTHLDKFSVFAIYRVWISAGVLSSLASLHHAEMRFVEAVGFIKQNASHYLRARMQKVLDLSSRGADEGDAIVASGLFDNDIAIQVAIYSKNKVFTTNMDQIAQQSINYAQDKLLSFSNRVNFLLTLFVMWFIVYSYDSLMALGDINFQ
ncbi:MAG: hypothetical protein Q9M92_00535 [Enterobacterales bacterium]|nr:hypothetical protein [Enterobacterales bacterium]